MRLMELPQPPPRSSENKGTRSSYWLYNQAVPLTRGMRASRRAYNACALASENSRSTIRRGVSNFMHIRFAPNRLCRIRLNQPTLLPAFDAFTNIQNP